MDKYVSNLYDFLNQLENKHLKEFVKSFNEPNGFIYSTSNQYCEIMNGIYEDGHSAASIALCARECQRLFNLEENINVVEEPVIV